MNEKTNMFANMTTRQKATAGIFVLIMLFLLWQVWGLFRGSKPTPAPAPAKHTTAMNAAAPGAATANPATATPAPTPQLPKPAMTQREMELMQLQKETEAKYVAAINELQMLKVTREIAETNQAIMSAKLATITAQKNILEVLTKPSQQATPANYSEGLVNPTAGAPLTPPGSAGQGPTQAPPAQITPPPPTESAYTVISVTQLRYRWGAVLGYEGNLYNVSIGDILPPDGSKVIGIDKSGVMLEKNNVRKRISLVPII